MTYKNEAIRRHSCFALQGPDRHWNMKDRSAEWLPQTSQAGPKDPPKAMSRKGLPNWLNARRAQRAPSQVQMTTQRPRAKVSKQPLEATTGLEKRGRETGRPPPTGLQRTPRRLPTKPKGPPKGPPEGSQPSPKDLQKGPRKGSLEIGPEKGVHHPCDPRPEGPQTLQIPRFFGFGHPGRHTRVWGLPAPIFGPIFGVPG